jgi:tetratricopeptide (TPR) repeat protein
MSLNTRFVGITTALALGASAARAQCPPTIQKLAAERKYTEAKPLAQAAVAKAPDDDKAWQCLGRITQDMDRPKESVEYFEKAIRIDDKVANHHLFLGSALADLADSTNKIKLPFLARRIKGEFERTVALDPSSVDGRLALVDFYTQAPGVMGGSKDKAQEQLREVIRLNPMRGHHKQANLYLRDRKYAEAEKALILSEQSAPDSIFASYNLLSFYLSRERWSDAFATLDRMEQRFPDEWQVRFQMGRAAAVSGDRLERGEKELRALIASPPPDMARTTLASAHHRLGMILEKQGKKEQARAEYTVAVTLDPKNENAKKSLAALR